MPQAQEQPSIETRIRQLTALAGFIASVLARLPFEQLRTLLKDKTTLRKNLQMVFQIPVDPYADVRIWWQEFYFKYFKIVIDFSEVLIPEKPTDGPHELQFHAKGLTMNGVIAVMRSLFKVWTYQDDLDATVTINTRTSAQSYAIWVRTGVEPDQKYLGKSTRDADMDGKIGMTLLERLVLEVKYFVATGQHLDVKGVTLCTGSRYSGGSVPSVCWRAADAEVDVGAFSVDISYPTFGLRSAVSL